MPRLGATDLVRGTGRVRVRGRARVRVRVRVMLGATDQAEALRAERALQPATVRDEGCNRTR